MFSVVPFIHALYDSIPSNCSKILCMHLMNGFLFDFLLPKESSAFVGDRYPVLCVNIQLFFSSSQLLLKFVNVGNLHSVHQCQPLPKKEMRN